MEIVEYQKKYEPDFVRLNTDWIKRYFVLEDADLDILDHVQEWLEAGAMIFFAVDKEQVLATCMALPLGNDIWEICKLAAAGQHTGTGAGSAVFKRSMDYALTHGAKKLTLISNRRLKQALHIYRKFGFLEVPLNKAYWGYDRADIEMEYIPQSTQHIPS